jgi:MFS family permease
VCRATFSGSEAVVNPWRGLSGLPRTSFVLALATLVNRAGVMVRPFLVIYLTTHLGFTMEEAGRYLLLYGLTTLVAAPLAGRLIDRFGARGMMRTCLLLSSAALLIYPLARTPGWLVAATVTFSLFNEMPRPALMTLATEVVPASKRKHAIVLLRLSVNLGLAIGPAVAGFIVAPRAGRSEATAGQVLALFLIDAGSNLAAALILWLTRLPRGEVHGGAPAARAGLLGDPRLRLLFVAATLNAIVFWQHESSLALYIKEILALHLTAFGRLLQPEEIYGFTITLNTILIVLLEVELNTRTHHWPQRRSLVLGSALVALGFGGMAFAHGAGAIALNVVLFTFGEMFLMPALSNYAISIAPPLKRGTYMSALTLSFGTGFAIGPWLGTTILHRCGAPPLWGGALLVGLVATLCFARLPEPPAEHSAEGEAQTAPPLAESVSAPEAALGPGELDELDEPDAAAG